MSAGHSFAIAAKHDGGMDKLTDTLDPTKLGKTADSALDVIVAVVTTYGFRVLGAVVILLVGNLISKLVFNGIKRACQRTHRIDATICTFLAQVSRYTVMTFTLVAVLTTFGVETTSLVAALGAVGLAVGLAVQGTLSNFAAGLMLIIFRPFHIGEYIEASGVAGTVREISLFTTELDTFDNLRVVVPNGKIWGEVIRNYSRNDRRRLDLRVRVSYADDVEGALRLVRSVIAADARVLQDPAPVVAAETLGELGIVLVAQIWLRSPDFQRVQFDLNAKLARMFEDGTFNVPAPRPVVSSARPQSQKSVSS